MHLKTTNIKYNGDKMKIAIFGSTGFVGKVLINKALTEGYQVRTLARYPEKLEDIKDRIEIIKGSVFDPLKVEAAIEGTMVVFSTIGPPPGKPCDPKLYEKTMQDIVRIMDKNGIKRYIYIGGAGHEGGENENWTFNRRFLRLFQIYSANKFWLPSIWNGRCLKNQTLTGILYDLQELPMNQHQEIFQLMRECSIT